MMFPKIASAQTDSTGGIQIRGTITLTGDIYTFQSDSNIFRPTRPPNLWRLIFTPTVQITENIILPFNIVLSSVETNETTPKTASSSFMQFLLSPVNDIGLMSFAPKLGWATFFLGSHTPHYSGLSACDYQIFGAGTELRPGKLRLSSSAGIVQRAIEPDSTEGIPGSFARWMYMMKIGYGRDEDSFADLNIVRMRDDPASISRRHGDLREEEGFLVSSNFRIGITDHISAEGEIGTSAFTRDMTSSDISDEYAILSPFIHQRISTRVDYAGEFSVDMNYPAWGLKGGMKYIGPGYVAIGFPYLQSDRLDFQLSPRVVLFESKLMIDGSIGHRTDDLLETKGAKTTQMLGSLNVFTTPMENLSLSLSYSNFGIRSNQSSDTLRIQSVAQSLSISPSYSISTVAINHLFSISILLDAYTEYNTVTRRTNENHTNSFIASYFASFLRIPLSVNVSLQHFAMDAEVLATKFNSLTVGVSYRFPEPKLVLSSGVTYSLSQIITDRDESHVNFRLGAVLTLEKIKLSLQIQRNIVDRSSLNRNDSKSENHIQSTISYSF